MSTIWDKKQQAAYRKTLDTAANDAAEFVNDYYDAIRLRYPHASVAELRDAAIEAIDMSLNAFGPQAAEIAAQLFEQRCKAEGIDVKAKLYDTIDRNLVDKKVRYYARSLVNNNEALFRKRITALTRHYVHREAQQNLLKNCIKNGVKWARVPSGIETCGFCFMLSTSGFVYHTKKSAGGDGHKFHIGCDCIIVPGTEKTVIEGYDPDAMYKRWCMCAETLGLQSTHENLNKIITEVETRDFSWLNGGRVPEVTYASESIKYSVTVNNPWEGRTAHRLAKVGIKPDFQVDYKTVKTDGVARRVGLPDFSNGIEIKTPRDSNNAYGAVKNYVGKTNERKIEVKRMIIDNTESNFSDDDLIMAIRSVSEELGVNYKIACFTKTGKLLNIT